MASIYFAGHDSFGNRGCEALIRSNVQTLHGYLPLAKYLVPSNDIARDSAQWPESATFGVQFIEAEPIPSTLRWWSRARRLFGPVSTFRPRLRLTEGTRRHIAKSDVLVMTGGDIVSLDYGLESLYFWMSICEVAMQAGVKTVLWGASVGPFSTDPRLEARMTTFLRRFDVITVREAPSHAYLASLGIDAEQVADSAFGLDARPPARPLGLPVLAGEGVLLGFNVSPVIEKFRGPSADRYALIDEVVGFLVEVVQAQGDRIVLVPHVDPYSGGDYNSDSVYMRRILRALRERGVGRDRADLLPDDLNAAELKHVIGGCDYFMGARTHATVAAFSMGVPTTSLAYSVKAKGINADVFGHLEHVLETPAIARESLLAHYALLKERGPGIRGRLASTIPGLRLRASASAERVAKLLGV